jgi:hypothetical protein
MQHPLLVSFFSCCCISPFVVVVVVSSEGMHFLEIRMRHLIFR